MKKGIVVFIFTVLMQAFSFAQCSMCKAVVESNKDKNAAEIAEGLNFGILYIMSIPYILMVVIAWVFFRKQISEKIRDLRLSSKF
jgi:hypothetical protein